MSKYHVSPVSERTIHGHMFDSKAEMVHFLELSMRQRAGEIKDLELQPEYVLLDGYVRDGKKVRPIVYCADFRYLDLRSNRIIVEDVKGAQTAVYKLKKKMLLARYPDINFREVKAQ